MPKKSKGLKIRYIIPEVREPTSFDYIVKNWIPELFKVTEYFIVVGFIQFLHMRTELVVFLVFSFVLHAALYFYISDKLITFVKSLRFKTKFRMRSAAVSIGFFYIFLTLLFAHLVYIIAKGQLA